MADELIKMLQDEFEENEEENASLENENKTLEKSEIKTFSKSEMSTESVENAENVDLDNIEKNAEKTPSQNLEITSENFEENANWEEDEDEENAEIDNYDEDENGGSDLDFEDEDFDEEDEDWEEEDELGEMAESDQDPLDHVTKVSDEPPSATIEDLKKVSSAKNLKNLEKLGFIALDRADKMKAGLCSYISGQHMAEYTADDELKEALLDAIKEYLATQEFKALTPAQTLLLAIAMWSLPPLALASWHKYEAFKQEEKKKKPSAKKPSSSNNEDADAKSDYSHLKEFQENRRSFTTNKTKGTYDRTPKGTFINLDIANEKPSPEIQELLDEGLKSKQIREIIYGE